MVVGIVDEHGSSVISCGDLDNGTDRQADGDTVFSIQSASYTFFCLLLEDMVERGAVQPDEPVAKYLPASIKMPTYHGKQITVRQVAKETSGLRPSLGDAIDPKRADNPFEGFTAEKFFALLSDCRLTSEPGTTHLHGGVDRGVLNQALALKAGMDYESLLRSRVLRPWNMNDTGLTLTPEQESRLAPEHSKLGCAMPRLAGGRLHSPGRDLLDRQWLAQVPIGLRPRLVPSAAALGENRRQFRVFAAATRTAQRRRRLVCQWLLPRVRQGAPAWCGGPG